MAEDNSHSPLDALPTELQILIMTRTSSPQSLYALVRTSRHLYRVFSLSKQKILSAMVHETLYPELLPDARAAAFLSLRKPPLAVREDYSALIHMYENDRKKTQAAELIPLTMSISMCQLHQSVEYFVRDFVERCATFFATRGCPLNPDDLPLSRTEKCRIQRALYRFHIYGCLSYSNGNEFVPLGSLELKQFFYRNFPSHENEEIFCILDYLYVRLLKAYDRIKDRSAKSVLGEMSEIDESVGDKSKEINESVCNTDSDSSMNHGNPARLVPSRWDSVEPDSNNFFSRSHKRDYYLYVDGQISEGLPSLRQFLEADISEQTNLVKNFRLPRETSHSPKDRIFRTPHRIFTKFEKTITFTKDDLNKPNEAYIIWTTDRWSRNEPRCRSLQHFCQGGYVFWDWARLRLSGIMTEYDLRNLSSMFKTAANLYIVVCLYGGAKRPGNGVDLA
ncbi:hypothetical protein MMC22_011745 [Lobaria immixta]|nr:hypothetical protein [Lobaria immixta]